ncbi:hypothetical protein PshuTeo1_43550 [Pseudomonas hunanensis]|nr:hypothetical protein PshuTeo1_43550 [Pseudomonas hunanensis]
MGVKVVANDIIAPWNSRVIPPVTRGLRGWFTFDTDAGRFKLNRAIGGTDAVMVGTPVAYSTHGRFKGGVNYLQTNIEETDEQTILVVGKAVALPASSADGAFYVGNYNGNSKTPGYTGSAFGTSIFHQSPTTLTAGAGRDNGSGVATSGQIGLTVTPTSWALRAMRTKSLVPTDIYNLTTGAKASSSNALARVLAESNYRIGSATTLFSGEVDISAVAIYDKYLSDDEIAQVATAMRRRMTRLGITV